jgi:hypothetical protein
VDGGDGQPWADAVEKVGGDPVERNSRIIAVGFLKLTCAFDSHFQSIWDQFYAEITRNHFSTASAVE